MADEVLGVELVDADIGHHAQAEACPLPLPPQVTHRAVEVTAIGLS